MEINVSHASIINQRDENEDNIWVEYIKVMDYPTVAVYLVADGMGGFDMGAEASRAVNQFFMTHLQKNIHKYVYEKTLPIDLKGGMKEIVEKTIYETNQSMYEMVDKERRENGIRMGTTITAAVIVEDVLIFTNIGDSPMYICHEGDLILLSDIQNRAHADYLKGRYELHSPEYEYNSCLLLNYAGRYESENIEIKVCQVPVEPGNCILMGSDGAFGSLMPEEIEDILAHVYGGEKRIEKIMEEARELGETDNQSLIICETV